MKIDQTRDWNKFNQITNVGKMKFFAILVVSFAVTAAMAVPVANEESLEKATGVQKLDMKEVEKLLAQIETEQSKPKPEDGTVSESLNKLFATFRQVSFSYQKQKAQ